MRGKQARRMDSRAYRALFDNGALKKQKKTSGISGLSASSASVTTCRPGLSHNSSEALEVRSNKENVNLSKSEKNLHSLLKLDIATLSETPTLPVITAESVVSGDNLSLYVDFSAFLVGTNCSNLSPMPTDELPSEGTGGQDSNKKSSWIFQAGDPVWIRTKNQSWWPGKICGQGNGSENPSEVDQMNCLLVSYLGTTHTVWCLRTHLKPFHENFEQMEGQNKARSYLEAVEKAAAEFGNLLKPVMSCSCDLETKVEGSLVGQKVGRFEKFSASHFEPQNLLLQLKDWAKSGSRLNLLELTVMKARLYVFYKFVGRNQLPMNQLKKLSKKNGSLPGEETSATPLEDSRKDGETCGSDPSSNKRKRRQKKFFVIEGIDAAKDLL